MSVAAGELVSVPFAATVRSEWTKLRTTRAAVSTAVAAAVVTFALTALHCANAPAGQIDAVGASLFGITVAQFVAGVCGALAVTNEYSSSTMRVSLVATPRRAQLFTGKILLLLGAALGYGVLVAGAAFASGWSLLGAQAHTADPALAVRRIMGAATVLTAMTLIGAGCGYLTRHSAGAIVCALSVLVLPKLILDALPAADRTHLLRYTPLSAADSLVSEPVSTNLAPLPALCLLTAEVLALLAVAGLVFARRDA